MPKPTIPGWIGLLLLGALFSGCLPSSCNRTESRDLFPSDSTSRAIAAAMPVDTLELAGVLGPDVGLQLKYPRTLAYSPSGDLWIADTDLQRVVSFSEQERTLRAIETGKGSFPYIAGFRGDTLIVFSPPFRELTSYVDGERVDLNSLGAALPARGALQYATIAGDEIYLKVIAEDFSGFVSRRDRQGFEIERWDLGGPYWQYAGLLRVWGDSLISLSGYRPIVHVLPSGAPIDTLRLVGFDSPMLARSRSFVLGQQSEPPLLTASAAALGPFLFVLNMRPGWLNVDVYDHGGRLLHVLTQPSPAFNQNYYPTDIAALEHADGSIELAVAVLKPKPAIELYLWRPKHSARR